MKYKITYVGGFLFLSCGQITNPSDSELVLQTDSSSVTQSFNKTTELITKPGVTKLNEKVFSIGSKSHFTDSCTFYFECDCCSGDLIFNGDSTFYYKDYCVADIAVTKGKYLIADNILSLEYSGRYVSRIYNWDYDTDSSSAEYSITDTIIEPFRQQYLITLCRSKIKLTEAQNLDLCAIETNGKHKDEIDLLIKQGFLNYFTNIIK